MSVFLLVVFCCASLVRSSPCGMSNATSTKQLEMVPPCEIISVAMENKADNIPSELVPKNYNTHSTSLASMCFPHGDLKDDPWWRGTDKLQIDSIGSNHTLFKQDQAMLFFFKVLPPLSQYNGSTLLFGSLPFDHWSKHNPITANGDSRSRTSAASPSWLAPSMHALQACMTASLDVMMSMQMMLLSSFPLVLVLGALLAVCACVLAVILDTALAIVGLAITVASAPPTAHIHAISCIMKMCMRMIFSRMMIKTAMLIYIISSIPLGLAVGRDDPTINTNEYTLPGDHFTTSALYGGLPYALR